MRRSCLVLPVPGLSLSLSALGDYAHGACYIFARMNTYQAVATFIFRLYACWLAFSGLLGLGYALIGLLFRLCFYDNAGSYFGQYVELWPADLGYLVAAWLLFRFSARLGRRVGQDLGSPASSIPPVA